jgi:hypothetical protein
MNTGKVVGGSVLIFTAIWVFMMLPDFTARFLGAAILGILGLYLLIAGMNEE